MLDVLKIINMADVAVEKVKWVWYPYIPYGKVTIVQGDPGEGKTTFILALVSLLTQGNPMPEEKSGSEPINVIYQTAEDGLADTIKPRLLASGADCSRVLVIDETDKELTLCDKRLEQGIQETGAKVIILDPLQAYLGGDVDMHRANEVRPVFKRLFATAEKTGCAVILIGHMNKDAKGKALYRGLGSIDFSAAVRSILVVGRAKDDKTMRIIAHSKSNLAPEGQSVAFELGENCSFCWKGCCDVTVDALVSGTGSVQTKTVQMENMLRDMLDVPVPSTEIYQVAADLGIAERTVKIAKKNVGVVSEKTKDGWMCSLPEFEKPKRKLRTE